MLKKILLGIGLLIFFTISYFSIKSWRFTNHTKTETCLEFERIQYKLQYTLGGITPSAGFLSEKMFDFTWTMISFVQKLYNITDYDRNWGSCQKIEQQVEPIFNICNQWIYRDDSLSNYTKNKKVLQCILEYTANNIIIDSIKVNNILQQEAINKDKNQENTQSNINQGCKEQSSEEYLTNKSCLEKIKNLGRANIYNAIDQCFSYRNNIDYSSKNICYENYKRNDVLYSICVESVRKDNSFDNLGDPLVMLQFRINMEECMSKIVFRNDSFSRLSKELGNESSYQVCNSENDCSDQEICNRNMTMRCEKSENRLLSLKELEPIIKNNDFVDQGCGHDGGCSIRTLSGSSYAYKNIISNGVNILLKKYNKEIVNQRTE